MPTIEDVVKQTAIQAMEASCQGTYSVGGLLMDIEGNIIKLMHNNVVQNNLTNDPTAHGERQLIDWYFENKESNNLPEPSNIILVTSLDPCVMCTGSILTAGFKLVIISANDTYAGINYDKTASFPSLAGTPMQIEAQESFSYPEVSGNTCFTRLQSGANIPDLFTDQTITEQTYALCSSVFDATLEKVSNQINSDVLTSELINPLTLPTDNIIYLALKEFYPNALNYTAPFPTRPEVGLAEYLIDAANQDLSNGGEGNSVAFLDYFGNLLFCFGGKQNLSKIQTAFMIATRNYSQLRYNLTYQGATDVEKYLCHPKYGTFIFAKSPSIDSLGLVDLGGYGSTMEGPIILGNRLQYGVELTTQSELQDFCDNLPPFYSDDDSVNIHIEQISDQELIDALINGLPSMN